MKAYTLILSVILFAGCSSRDSWTLRSPSENVKVVLSMDQEGMAAAVFVDDKLVIDTIHLGLELNGYGNAGSSVRVIKVRESSSDTVWERPWGRTRQVRDHYNQLELSYETGLRSPVILGLQFRAYDQGIAFRYLVPGQDGLDTVVVKADLTRFCFREDPVVWATHYAGSYSHQENEFLPVKLSEAEASHLPLLVHSAGDLWVAVTEARLRNWAGFHLVPGPGNPGSLRIVLEPRFGDPTVAVITGTPAVSPWRVAMLAESPGKFLEYNLIQNLNDPCVIGDVSWIRPGKAAWDWWWSNSYAPDAGFELGSNQQTMKYFIDFASEMGWEYQLVDWHWYGPPFAPTDSFEWNPSDADITTCNPEIDIPELVKYAADRNVRLFLWLEWHHADAQMEEAFSLYEKWGVAGVKIDFMAREDQEMVGFYERVARLASRHHLLVDFHGAYKPTGLSRTFPNLITREGVMGNEYTKWSERITPEHTVSLAFTRNMLGEMDFTPGAWVNVTPSEFSIESERGYPVVMSTRANQLAMFVVYESALQVICDSPYHYRQSPQGLDFLKMVPTTWDETVVVNESIGDYITVARRSGDDWYIGSMTDGEPRDLDIPLDFLGNGNYEATVWSDGEDADRNPTSLARQTLEVDANSHLEAKLAPGGGQVIHLTPLKN